MTPSGKGVCRVSPENFFECPYVHFYAFFDALGTFWSRILLENIFLDAKKTNTRQNIFHTVMIFAFFFFSIIL